MLHSLILNYTFQNVNNGINYQEITNEEEFFIKETYSNCTLSLFNSAAAYDAVIDGSNNLYITGHTNISGSGSFDVFLAKYNSSGDQIWNQTWGLFDYETSRGVATDDNDIYIAGYTNSSGAGLFDAFLVKYNSSGSQLWNKTWGGPSDDLGNDIKVDSEGNVYLIGKTESFGAGPSDMFIVKYNSTGFQLWNLTWGGSDSESGECLAIDSQNNLYLTGGTLSFNGGSLNAFLVKYDSSGNEEWLRIWGGSNDDEGYGIVVDKDDNLYITGATWSFGSGGDIFIVKYNYNGILLWNSTWGGNNYECGQGLAVDGSNNVYLAGFDGSWSVGPYNAVLLKYDSEGNYCWYRSWGDQNNNDVGTSVAIDCNNNCYLSGYTNQSGVGYYNAFLVKYKFEFTHLQEWIVTWGSSDFDYAYSVSVDAYKKIYMVGYTDSYGAGSNDVFLVKLDSLGNQIWNLTWGGSGDEIGESVTIDAYNNCYLAGLTYSFSAGGRDAFLIKYDLDGNQLWNRTWGGSGDDVAVCMTVDKKNNSYITGLTNSSGAGDYDIFIVAYNSSGIQLWNRTWGGPEFEMAQNIAIDDNDNIYITGVTQSFGTASSWDVVLIKYDPAGNQLWNRTWGGDNNEEGRGNIIDNENNCYLTGYTWSFGVERDLILLKYDFMGNLLWNRTWGGSDQDFGESVVVDEYNSVYIAGETKSYGEGGYDAFFLKSDSCGNLLWNYTWGGLLSDRYEEVAIDNEGNCYAVGATLNFGAGSSDAALMKYGIDLDNDGLTNDMESIYYRTDFNDPDTDDDGLKDGTEVLLYYTNATNPDTDGDLMNDGWEITFGLNPSSSIDAYFDPDNDTLFNYLEFNFSTNPLEFNSFLNISFSCAPYTIQGENISLQVDIFNQLTGSVNINISIFNELVSTGPKDFLNFALNPGNNLLHVNLTIEEFVNIGISPIIINFTRFGHLIASNTTNTLVLVAYQFPSIQIPDSITQNILEYLSVESINNRSVPIEYIITLNGTGFVTVNMSVILLSGDWKSIQVPLEFIPISIYETGERNFTLTITYKGRVLYKYEGKVDISLSGFNLFLGYLLPIFLGIIVVAVSYRTIRRVVKKRALALKQRQIQMLLDLKGPFNMPALRRHLKAGQPEVEVLLNELLEGEKYPMEEVGLWNDQHQLFIPALYLEQIGESIVNLIQDDLSSNLIYTKGQLTDKASLRKITLKSLSTSHKVPVEIIRQILKSLVENGKIGGYFTEKSLCLPLSFGFGVIVLNAWVIDLAPEGLSRMFFDLEKWSKLILEFMAEHQHPPRREEAWRIGIPFERIDAVLNYTNIQIQMKVFPYLSPIEKEYFDQLSYKVIKYINQSKAKPTYTDLVVEVGLGVKDAKLIIPYINEVLGIEIQIGGIEHDNEVLGT
ncbi:MAG: SBBP repeat-containing protein [Candidatus Helarchaeota archaeon]